METQELFYRLSVALAIGLVVGIERGWATRTESEGERTAGLRTFALSGLLGGVMGALAQALPGGATMLGLAFVAYAASMALYRYREMVHEKTFGATTLIAGYLAFGLGALAVLSEPAIAAAAGVAATALLALKAALHSWLGRLTWEELRAALVLLAMTLILLPLLPNRDMGPFGAFNPYELWLMTILIAGVSAAGYVAMKWSGNGGHGVALSGVAGGLVSSTAATISFARLARKEPDKKQAFLAGALLANATMMARILFLAGSINVGLLRWLVAPLLAAGAVLVGAAVWHLARGGERMSDAPMSLKNPFDLPTVLKFGALLAIIMAVAKTLTTLTGENGAYALAAISGIADVDAITLTLSRLAGTQILAASAAAAILIAAGVNTVSKVGWGWGVGGREFGVAFALSSSIALLAAVAGFVATAIWDPFAVFAPHLSTT